MIDPKSVGKKLGSLLACCLTFFALISNPLTPLQAQVTANFSANTQSGCSPLTVQFTNLSTGPITHLFLGLWKWKHLQFT